MCSSPGNRSSSESQLGTHRYLERERDGEGRREGGRRERKEEGEEGGGRGIREGGRRERGGKEEREGKEGGKERVGEGEREKGGKEGDKTSHNRHSALVHHSVPADEY